MEIELLPTVSLLPETFSILIAPVEMLTGALNSHLELQSYKILFISGNYPCILNRLNRNSTKLEVRRAFTAFQLMTILEKNHHSHLIVEHDPMLYEDAGEMVEYLAQALKHTSREATILLCSTRQAMDTTSAEDGRAGRYDNVTELSLRPQFLLSIVKKQISRPESKNIQRQIFPSKSIC